MEKIQQLTSDSGTSARLGAFEGRVVVLGGSIGYTFEVGKLPISTRLKVYREFATVNGWKEQQATSRCRCRSSSMPIQ